MITLNQCMSTEREISDCDLPINDNNNSKCITIPILATKISLRQHSPFILFAEGMAAEGIIVMRTW